MTHIFHWKAHGRKGLVCRIVATGKLHSALVEFVDGYRMVTSRYAVRRRKIDLPRAWSGAEKPDLTEEKGKLK